MAQLNSLDAGAPREMRDIVPLKRPVRQDPWLRLSHIGPNMNFMLKIEINSFKIAHLPI